MVHVKRFTSPTQKRGARGEALAVEFLQREGFTIVARNVSGSYGEIDIIAKKGGVYYFFEVKAGNPATGIHPAENLTPTKIRKVLGTVAYYAMIHHIGEYRVEGVIVLMGDNPSIYRTELF